MVMFYLIFALHFHYSNMVLVVVQSMVGSCNDGPAMVQDKGNWHGVEAYLGAGRPDTSEVVSMWSGLSHMDQVDKCEESIGVGVASTFQAAVNPVNALRVAVNPKDASQEAVNPVNETQGVVNLEDATPGAVNPVDAPQEAAYSAEASQNLLAELTSHLFMWITGFSNIDETLRLLLQYKTYFSSFSS